MKSLTALQLARLALVLAICAQGHAQSDFLSLNKHVRKEITVETKQGDKVRGNLLRVEEGRIVVYEAGAPKTITRESVMRVTRHKSRHTAAWIAGMSAAGLATGFVVGLRQYDDAIDSNNKVGAVALGGAGAGAAAGYGLSRLGKQEQVVYRAEE